MLLRLTACLVAMAQLALADEGCLTENARYEQRTAPSITARFRAVDSGGNDWPAHVALQIHIGSSGRSYWWLPWNGGTNGQQNLASTTDVDAAGWVAPGADDGKARPLGDVSYIGMDARYNVIQGIPRRGRPAPAHFFAPDLREALWYRTDANKRYGDARQFFDLVGCAKSSGN